MRYVLIAAVFGFLSLMPVVAQACSCVGPGSPAEAMEKARAVFIGHVSQLVKNTAHYTDRVIFRVDKVWKGDPGKEFTLGLPRHGCAYWNFEDQTDYLIYAEKSWDQNDPDGYSVTMCSRTKPLEKALIETRYLDAAVAGKDAAALDKGLIEILLSEQPDHIRAEAAVLLGVKIRNSAGDVPEDAVKALITASQHGGRELKITIANSLASYHLKRRADVKAALIILLNDKVFSVRSAAAGALSMVARNDSTAFVSILTSLEKTRVEAGDDMQTYQRIFAALGQALAATAATDEEKAQVVDILLGLVDNIPDPYDKVSIIQHIGFQKGQAAKAVPKLLEILKIAKHDHLKRYSLLALGDIGVKGAAGSIKPYLKDKNCHVLTGAMTALYKIDAASFSQMFEKEISTVVKARFDKCSYELTSVLQNIGQTAKPLKAFLSGKYQAMPDSDWKKKGLGDVLKKL